MNSDSRQVLTEQIAYYRARAGEYDQWFLRQGRYDRGPEMNQRWHDQAQIVLKLTTGGVTCLKRLDR